MWWFSEKRRSGASNDGRVNAEYPLAPGSSRKQYSKNKEMLIFRLVSWYAQTKISPGSWRNNETEKRIVTLLSDSSKILNNEQIDNEMTHKSKPIMQRNSLFPKKWNG